MLSRAASAATVVLIGLAATLGQASAQLFPPGPPISLPNLFGLPPPVATEDTNPPAYDPPPGYGQLPPPGPQAQPPHTYEPRSLPPPTQYGRDDPSYPPPQQGYPQQGYQQAPQQGHPQQAHPQQAYPPPQQGYQQPQYGSVPQQQQQQQQQQNGLRPPISIGPGQQQQASPGRPGQTGHDITSTLPPEDRPETGPRKELPPQFRRTTVDFRSREPVGTIVIDTSNTYLYLVLGNGKAIRYGIGVGREGFTWAGAERVSRMAEWPDWHPPTEMIERQPYLPRFMAGGEGNPLGARALYLGKTLYRIHGTNQPSTIGTFVSSGCIRLTNEDVIDLYYRVKVGTRVVVMAKTKPPATASAAPVQPSPQRAPGGQQHAPAAPQYEPIPLQPPPVIRAQ
ncbi:MAG: L,D-transpeptidase [Xanthobacteraceae bacterium]